MTETFQIVPAGAKPLWVIAPVIVVLLVVMAALAVAFQGSRRATFELSTSGLRLRGDFWGRFIPATQLEADAARLVDLTTDGPHRPRWRTFGTGLPGYRAGWFRLASGEKALLYVTDLRRVVYLPTGAGYSVLLSVRRPEAFLDRLRALTPD